jgi:hypothetical protein
MKGDEHLGETIVMKGEKFSYTEMMNNITNPANQAIQSFQESTPVSANATTVSFV